jgi:hypothetical protein
MSQSYYPPPTPHSHDKYIIAIVLLAVFLPISFGVLGFIVGLGASSTISNPAPTANNIHLNSGTVRMDPASSGTAFSILFDSQITGTLSSRIYNGGSWQSYMPSGTTFTVTVEWGNLTQGSAYFGFHTCTPRPSILNPDGGPNQSFICEAR